MMRVYFVRSVYNLTTRVYQQCLTTPAVSHSWPSFLPCLPPPAIKSSYFDAFQNVLQMSAQLPINTSAFATLIRLKYLCPHFPFDVHFAIVCIMKCRSLTHTFSEYGKCMHLGYPNPCQGLESLCNPRKSVGLCFLVHLHPHAHRGSDYLNFCPWVGMLCALMEGFFSV